MTARTDWTFFALLVWAVIMVTTFFGIHLATVTEAGAVSLKVRLACADDYFAHCSMYSPGSQEVRRCMRKVGRGLSPRCIQALKDSGEIKRQEVADRRR